jgi:hypothetical protein
MKLAVHEIERPVSGKVGAILRRNAGCYSDDDERDSEEG